MENNNEWNRGLNSALQGLGALGQGFIIKGQKNDANATYNEARTQLMSNYDKLMKFNTDKLELANTNPEVNTEGVKNDLYSKLLGDYENAQQKLQNNPYGQTSAKVLEDYYSKLIPNIKPDYQIIPNTKTGELTAVDKNNPRNVLTVRKGTPETEKWVQVPGSKSFTSEENGKYYVTQMKQSPDGETKLVKTELNKEDYESWKKYNPTFEEKEGVKLDNKISFKLQFPSLGRGRRTNASGEEMTSSNLYGEMQTIWKQIQAKFQAGQITNEEAKQLIANAYLSYEPDLEKSDIKQATDWFNSQGIDINSIRTSTKTGR